MGTQRRKGRQAVTFSQFLQLQSRILRRLMSSSTYEELPVVDQLKGHAVVLAIHEGRFDDAVSLAKSLTEQLYGEARLQKLMTQLSYLVRKVPYAHPNLKPQEAAVQKFVQAEEDCRATNEALRPVIALLNGNDPSIQVDPGCETMVRILCRARYHVARVIGNAPNYAELWNCARFSAGAAQGVSGDATHLLRKLDASSWTVTPSAYLYARAALRANPYAWEALFGYPHYTGPADFGQAFSERVCVVEHDKIAFVPKDAETDRSVGTQASLNVYIQNGIGEVFRKRLKDRAGIDLKTAQDRHGYLAKLGSSCEGQPFSTIDLKAASDTISISIVKLLVPPEWFGLMDAVRGQSYVLPGGGPQRYHKFCAMGNGFCFGLETLLFWSLVQATYDEVEIPDRTCAVYGDDIIVYQGAALLLIEALNVCGFEVNTSKTFVHGPFKESCGQDYYGGVNIRPVILDGVVEHWGHVYHLHNGLRRRGYSTAADILLDFVPSRKRFIRPEGVEPARWLPESGYTDNPYLKPSGLSSDTAMSLPRSLFLRMVSTHKRYNHHIQEWQWKERLAVPITDEAPYPERYHMWAALGGADSCEGTPRFAYRRQTRVSTRWVPDQGTQYIEHPGPLPKRVAQG